MQNNNIITLVSDIYIECQINTLPIDCFSILHHFGFKVFSYTQLKEENTELYILCSKYSNDAFMHKKKRIVVYNDKLNKYRIRFSVLHELGHYILDHKEDTKANEDEADEFASHFLAPRILIHKYNLQNADQIHDTFGLSYAASNRALISYREWYREISQRTPRQPTKPELQLEQIFFPKKEIPALTSSDLEDDILYDNFTDRYLYILRVLKAGLPLPAEYKKDLALCRKLGLKLI